MTAHPARRRPAPSRARELALAALALYALAVILALASGLVHIDHTGGTYGVSVGSDTRYCSIELNVPGNHVQGGGLDAWCQSGG